LNIWLLLAAVAAVDVLLKTNFQVPGAGAQAVYYLAISMHHRV